jgi:hypothetical protein
VSWHGQVHQIVESEVVGPVSASTPRRELATVVIVSAASAGFALFAASRSWSVDLMARPAPLPPATVSRSGSSYVPALTALALVALAAAGATVATRGRGRILVGLLQTVVGLALVTASVIALPQVSGSGAAWAVACAVAGLVVIAAGALVLRRGRTWPSLGTRYERAAGRRSPRGGDTTRAERSGNADSEVWDAIDRGEDPTASG